MCRLELLCNTIKWSGLSGYGLTTFSPHQDHAHHSHISCTVVQLELHALKIYVESWMKLIAWWIQLQLRSSQILLQPSLCPQNLIPLSYFMLLKLVKSPGKSSISLVGEGWELWPTSHACWGLITNRMHHDSNSWHALCQKLNQKFVFALAAKN